MTLTNPSEDLTISRLLEETKTTRVEIRSLIMEEGMASAKEEDEREVRNGRGGRTRSRRERLTLELEEQPRDSSNRGTDHVRRGSSETSGDHGDVLGDGSGGCERRRAEVEVSFESQAESRRKDELTHRQQTDPPPYHRPSSS